MVARDIQHCVGYARQGMGVCEKMLGKEDMVALASVSNVCLGP